LSLQIKGGLLGDRILPPEELVILANLPPKAVLVSKLLGQLQAPIVTLHNIVIAPLRGLLTVLQNKIQTTSK
jgi:ribosomal protein L10